MPRRGQQLERYVDSILSTLHRYSIHGHKNNPLRTMQGVTLQGEPFDYEIFMPGCIHLFDAKECSSRYLHWPISDFRDNSSRLYRQLESLRQCKFPHDERIANSNIRTYFLVWFKHAPDNQQLISYDTGIIDIAIAQGKKYLLPSDGTVWSLEEDIRSILERSI